MFSGFYALQNKFLSYLLPYNQVYYSDSVLAGVRVVPESSLFTGAFQENLNVCSFGDSRGKERSLL